ncbi:hypothetical protein VE00_02220 [Pseudogymnoascus sp. WSF 3629]|nr:hypothetical protein VE00_02220 [Pseudogymnoascus sp. WSF 3629]
MQVPTTFAVLFFALGAAALPQTNNVGPTVGPKGNAQCGNGQVISCCNTKSTSTGAGGLLGLGGVLDGVLGGNCNPLTIPVVGVAVPLSQACAGNQAACCTGDQHGLVNVQCTNVNI